MGRHTVTAHVWPCEVMTRQKSKTVWIATGEFMGEYLEQKGSSERVALKRWVEIAEFKYRSS